MRIQQYGALRALVPFSLCNGYASTTKLHSAALPL